MLLNKYYYYFGSIMITVVNFNAHLLTICSFVFYMMKIYADQSDLSNSKFKLSVFN